MHYPALDSGEKREMASSMIPRSSDQDTHISGVRRRRMQPHKAKFGPLPAKFSSEAPPAHKVSVGQHYTPGNCPCSHRYQEAAAEAISADISLDIFEQQAMECEPDNDLLFGSGKEIDLRTKRRKPLYWLSGAFSREGSLQLVGCQCCGHGIFEIE
jgi:hypothetical protein